jgi:hypothetical protein
MGACEFSNTIVTKGTSREAYREAVEEMRDYNGHQKVIAETYKHHMVLVCLTEAQDSERRHSTNGEIRNWKGWIKVIAYV